MINCEKVKELISQQIDGELSELDEKRLAEHLSVCSSCSAYQKDLNYIHEKLLQLPTVSIEKSIVDQLLEENLLEVDTKPKKKSFLRNKSMMGLVAAALLIVVWIPLSPMLSQDHEKFEVTEELPKMYGVDNKADFDSMEIQFTQDMGNGMGVTATESAPKAINDGAEAEVYQVKEEHHQLVIYKNGVEAFRTEQWDEDVSVEWSKEGEQQIVYMLYTKEGKIIATYRIDLLEKREEKIEN